MSNRKGYPDPVARNCTSTRNQHIIMFKKTVIKVWSGIYKLSGPTGLMRLAFDTGLGAKNPQGFGMIEKWQPRSESPDRQNRRADREV